MKTTVTRSHSNGMTRCSWWSVALFILFSTPILTANNWMPTPEIEGNAFACSGATLTYSTPSTTGNTYLWTLSGGGILSNATNPTATVEWTANPGDGPFLLTVTETDGAGLMGTSEFPVSIQSATLSCDDYVLLSLDQTGSALITPLMFLNGIDANNDNFSVEVTASGGTISYGDVVGCANIGEELTVKVTSNCNGNSCWGELEVEDKIGPDIVCPTSPLELLCDVNLNQLGAPAASDNCSLAEVILLDEVIDDSQLCTEGVLITQTWLAVDELGNSSTNCVRELELNAPYTIDFPSDREWECNQFAAFPNITEPTAFTGNNGSTGSGIPLGVNSIYCPYNYGFADDTLSTCSNGTLKIVRTWTVLNWCTGTLEVGPDAQGENNQQTIKVVDNTPPVITAVDGQILNALETSNYINQCKSMEFYEAPTVTDDCSEYSIRIFTSIGELDYTNGVDGAEGGTIPSPGLSIGFHTLVIEATDECGNVSELPTVIEVKDLKAPTPVCDEITEANLNNLGEVEVFAETFDDGSTDNCGICDFLVQKMDFPFTPFAPSVTFNCNDTGSNTVILRVFDCSGNTNDCMVELIVNDKLNPTCIAPPNVLIDCSEIPVDSELADPDFMNNLFGTPFSNDNCAASINYFPIVNTVDNCGEGVLIRGFQAEDESGNTSGPCQQVIQVEAAHNWIIEFPANFEGACGDTVNVEDIEIINSGCDLLAASREDQLYYISDDSACYKIVRTYEIINWCNFDNEEIPISIGTKENGDTIVNTDFNNYGHYTYQQIIKITDDVAPTIDIEDSYEFCLIDEECLSTLVEIDYEIADECTNDIEATYTIDYDQDGTIDLTGSGDFSKNLPPGCHDVTFTVEDGCGNITEKVVEVCVKDCKAPTAYCEDGLIIEMNPLGVIDLWAVDFDAGSFDNCDDELVFSFSADTTDTQVIFECYEVPMWEEITVNIYVTDDCGNQGICETFVIINDNQWTCDDDPLVAGYVGTNDGEMLENTEIQLNGNGANGSMSDENGYFQMEVPFMTDVTLTPAKNDDPLNGVSTFDLVKISQHILNVQTLQTPYQMIAADANNSESITTLDLVTLRKLILHIDDEFNNNTSWRFVSADYEFPNPNNPWEENFPESIDYNNIVAAEMETDFTAIKIGDINGNASTNGLLSADDRTFTGRLDFLMNDQELQAGESYTIPVQILDNQSLLGFQYSLNFNQKAVQITNITEGNAVKRDNFGFTKLENGVLTSSWNASEATPFIANETLFSLEIKALQTVKLSEVLHISSDWTTAEAYQASADNGIELMEVQLQFETETSKPFTLFQNQPNPFQEQTLIGFNLAEEGEAIISIFDVTGKEMKQIKGHFAKGYHQITVEKTDLQTKGILFYQLEINGKTTTKKMVFQ